jgi:hypothetical protein
MKKAIFAIAILAITLASCGTGNTTECKNENCDSTAVQVDTVKADSTSTDTTTTK